MSDAKKQLKTYSGNIEVTIELVIKAFSLKEATKIFEETYPVIKIEYSELLKLVDERISSELDEIVWEIKEVKE